MTPTMTSAETVAAAKAVTSAAMKRASTSLTVGEHAVDVIVRVSGTVKRGEDYQQRIVAKADPWLLLAAALSKTNGVTVEALVREALASNLDSKAVKAQADKAMEAVKGVTMTPCNGKVTTSLSIEKVELVNPGT